MSQTGVEMHKRHQTTAQIPLHILYPVVINGKQGKRTYIYISVQIPVGGRRRSSAVVGVVTRRNRAGRGASGEPYWIIPVGLVTWCLSLVGRSINQLVVACIAPSTHNELRVNKIVKQTQHRLSETVTSTLGASFARCALHSVQSL